ncbi:MAG TPA: hypothetical protein ENH85_01225 [Candidatus Scalindua sp.]|nr:hypothetical protein [Candidatus Scalindua sp.]
MAENKLTITSEEAELLSQELDLLAKQEQGQNLEQNETETLQKITTLREELKERFSGEENPEQSTELQSALAQKEHFRTKHGKAQKEFEDYKKVNPPKSPPKPPKSKTKEEEGEEEPEDAEVWEASKDPLEIIKFNKTLQKYSEEETEFIMRNAPTKNLEGIIKATEDPMVQAAIQGMRDKVAKENKVPPPSPPGSPPKPADVEKTVKEGKEAEEVEKEIERTEQGKGEGV